MISAETLLQRASDVAYQSLGPDEDTVILSLRTGQLHTCNETTRAFLDALDRPRRFEEVLDRLHEQYDVSREKLADDMRQLVESLLREGIVVASS